MEIELNRMVVDDDPNDVSWHAEWGLRDDCTGIEDSGEDLAGLVAAAREDVREMADGSTVQLEWTIGGDRPEGTTIEAEIADLGGQLPGGVVA